MTDETKAQLARLPDLVVDAVDAVDAALEEKSRERILAAHEKLATLGATYDEVLAQAEGTERAQVEQRFGRRITDIRRQAARLPAGAMGRTTAISSDAGSVPFLEQRAPGKSIQEVTGTPLRRGQVAALGVGSEVEAWCGPCGGLMEHRVFAMVGETPQQVVCRSCGAKHGFRTEPARTPAPAPGASPSRGRGPTPEQAEIERKDRERMALKNELIAAEKVRPFLPKERYKAGEIIEHPSHGRGKIESITRGSLLVRFAHGLRPLDLT
jgi:hypothetical protein